MVLNTSVPKVVYKELLDVFDCIFVPASRDEKKALEKIRSLELNASHVPHSVVCTRLFLEASITDKDYHASGVIGDAQDKIKDIPMLYSVAIVRFAEKVFHCGHVKEFHKSTEHDKFCKDLETCYHRIAECKELLSLTVLRNASEACFQYLFTNYWHPQVGGIRSRLLTIAFSKQLASGLVAVLQDLESLSPSDTHIESSLTSLLTVISSRKAPGSFVPPSRQLLHCVAMVAGLKQRDTMRALRRFKLPEVLCEPAFVNVTNWCQALREALPRCLYFIESIIHSCSHENVTLSFFKDFLLLLYDPDLVSNAPIVLVVFWILARVPVALVDRLVSYLIHAITGIHLEKDGCGMDDTLLPYISPNSFSSCDSHGYFDHESFSLWLRTTEVPLEQEKTLRLYLGCNFGYQLRLLAWLRCLLLLPLAVNQTDDVEGLPLGLDFLMHVFYGPQVDAFLHHLSSTSHTTNRHSSHSSSNSGNGASTASLKDVFCQRFLSAISTTYQRVVASCRSMLDLLAYATIQCLLKKEDIASERGVRGILRLFKDTEVLMSKSLEGPFMDWLTRRLERQVGPVTLSKSHIIQRLFPVSERRSLLHPDFKRRFTTSLFEEFSSRLLSRQAKLLCCDESHPSNTSKSTVSSDTKKPIPSSLRLNASSSFPIKSFLESASGFSHESDISPNSDDGGMVDPFRSSPCSSQPTHDVLTTPPRVKRSFHFLDAQEGSTKRHRDGGTEDMSILGEAYSDTQGGCYGLRATASMHLGWSGEPKGHQVQYDDQGSD